MVKKRIILTILLVSIIIVGLASIFFTFFYIQKCPNLACFNSALAKCERASFVDEADDASWLYTIKGRIDDNCKVEVKLLQLKQGRVGIAGMENKEMSCFLDYKIIAKPQDNLDNCHGLLKEEMQKIIINKLHNYITDNLGKIAEELNKAI